MVYFFQKKKGIIPMYHPVALYFYSLTCCEHPSMSIKITLATPSVRAVRHQVRSLDWGQAS